MPQDPEAFDPSQEFAATSPAKPDAKEDEPKAAAPAGDKPAVEAEPVAAAKQEPEDEDAGDVKPKEPAPRAAHLDEPPCIVPPEAVAAACMAAAKAGRAYRIEQLAKEHPEVRDLLKEIERLNELVPKKSRSVR